MKEKVITLTLNEMRRKLEMNAKKVTKEWEEKNEIREKRKMERNWKGNEMERVRNMSSRPNYQSIFSQMNFFLKLFLSLSLPSSIFSNSFEVEMKVWY